MLDFWLRVKECLDWRDMTQKELAEAINESYNTLQSWINRNRLPDAQQSVKIASVLQTSVEFLVTGKNTRISDINAKAISLLEEALVQLKSGG